MDAALRCIIKASGAAPERKIAAMPPGSPRGSPSGDDAEAAAAVLGREAEAVQTLETLGDACEMRSRGSSVGSLDTLVPGALLQGPPAGFGPESAALAEDASARAGTLAGQGQVLSDATRDALFAFPALGGGAHQAPPRPAECPQYHAPMATAQLVRPPIVTPAHVVRPAGVARATVVVPGTPRHEPPLTVVAQLAELPVADAQLQALPASEVQLGGGAEHKRARATVVASSSELSLATADGDAAEDAQNGLSVLHACVHCHASKTACTDRRPCDRCIRLGLVCSSARDQPRKRACKGCHVGKVACEWDPGMDKCKRCKRLGIACEPRTLPESVGAHKRRRASAATGQVIACATGEDSNVSVAISLLQLCNGSGPTLV